MIVATPTANTETNGSQALFDSTKKVIFDFNLFRHPNKRSEDELKLQRIATRVFILLLFLTLIVLMIYSSLQNMTESITIENPSIAQANSLYEQYAQSVQCPCKTLSNIYQDFIVLQPMSQHPVCSSDFVNISSPWLIIDYPLTRGEHNSIITVYPNIDDFRHIASPFFQVINSLCQLSAQAINTKLLTFKSTAFITPNLIFNQQFKVQTNQFISQFVEDAAQSFISSLLLNNNMTHGNMLFSGLLSDSILTQYPDYYYSTSYFDYIYDYDRHDHIYNSSITGTECDCQRTAWCVQQAVVYELNAKIPLFPIPGKCVYVRENISCTESNIFLY